MRISLDHIRRQKRTLRYSVMLMVVTLLMEVVGPMSLLALTGGPDAPEFTAFEMAGTENMVNEFTGDFTYNLPVLTVPGPDGGGYSMSLAYQSGVSPEQEASWVGFGWTLNPGAINRQVRGVPDDFNGAEIVKFNKRRPSWTQQVGFDFGMEYNSQDRGEKKDSTERKITKDTKFLVKILDIDTASLRGLYQAFFNEVVETVTGQDPTLTPREVDSINLAIPELSLSLSHSSRFNNYAGFGISNSLGGVLQGIGHLSMSRSGGETTYDLHPTVLLDFLGDKTKLKRKKETSKSFFTWNNLNTRAIGQAFSTGRKQLTYNYPSVGYSLSYSVGVGYNFSGSLQINPTGPFGFQMGIKGGFNADLEIPKTTVDGFGYLYNKNFDVKYEELVGKDFYQVNDLNLSIPEADFRVEKPTVLNKHDKYLGIPFNNADVYTATSNLVGGSFRLHHKQVGEFYPTPVTTKKRIRQVGGELGIGGDIQIGLDLGIGRQKSIVSRWRNTLGSAATYNDDERAFFRFDGDPGGVLRYSQSDSLTYGTVQGLTRLLTLDSLSQANRMIGEFYGQESHIDYGCFGSNGELDFPLQTGVISTAGERDQIGQIAITNEGGTRLTFGQPVYARKEYEMSFGLSGGDNGHGNYLVYTNDKVDLSDPLTYSGEVQGKYTKTQYATAYLLTQITNASYVDVDASGFADANDFGGWTNFGYRQVWGGDKDWYNYRAPYTGLYYNRNRLSDLNDQTGSMTRGEKESYYLGHVNTKTHIAFFVTNQTNAEDAGNGSEDFAKEMLGVPEVYREAVRTTLKGSKSLRYDGLDAAALDNGKDPASKDALAKGEHRGEYLEKIVLYAKNDYSSPITTTYFDYDYSLCPGVWNNDNPDGSQRGKLTLKRVWTEGDGTISQQISPYQFHYDYPEEYPDEVKEQYQKVTGEITLLSQLDENPPYQPNALDAWGYYQLDGDERFKKMQPWVDQGYTNLKFDPAAWQLKRIGLPSGGEIQVQYEQKRYTHVQDKRAMAMVSLVDAKDSYRSGRANQYFPYLAGISIRTNNDRDEYLELLRDHYLRKKEKLYFKVLYGYIGEPNPLVGNSQLKSTEYITGYTVVDSVGLEDGRIFLRLGETRTDGGAKIDKTLPKSLCYQQLLGNGGYNLGLSTNYWEERDKALFQRYQDDYVSQGATEQRANAFLRELKFSEVVPGTLTMFGNWVSGKVKNRSKIESCQELNEALSYFKLPTFHAKRGGGIRVKRLLMYDPGMVGESGGAMLYGSTYHYVKEDGEESGVAVNEPFSIREENALTGFLERRKQPTIEKLLNGRDSKTEEGPLGESLLPGASIGHERVVVSNIHTGASSTGYQVSQYHTVRTSPSMRVLNTDLGKKNKTLAKSDLSLPLVLFNLNIRKAWMTQGYTFLLNDMHGKVASQATYPGRYNEQIFNPSLYTSRTSYSYSDPGSKVPAIRYDAASQAFHLDSIALGTEEDITFFNARAEEKINDFSAEMDLNIQLPAAIFFGIGLGVDFEDKSLSQHVTSKVIRRHSHLLSVTSTVDGVTQTTSNLAFDRYTGNPVLTKTYDGFTEPQDAIYTSAQGGSRHDGSYYSLQFPASWIYPGMGAKWSDVSSTNQLTATAGQVTTYGTSPLNTINASTGSLMFSNLVEASATVYHQGDWFTSNPNQGRLEEMFGATALAHPQLASKYYPVRTYVYRDEVRSANEPNTGRIYAGGIVESPILPFPWQSNPVSTLVNDHWFSAALVSTYSPHGQPLEEVDALGNVGAVKFGYGEQLPVMVAQNAEFGSIHFEDFEHPGPGPGMAGRVESKGHSGDYSFNYSANNTEPLWKGFLSAQLLKRGAEASFWVRSVLSDDAAHPDYQLANPNPNIKVLINGTFYPARRVASTGQWSLYEAQIPDWNNLAVGGEYEVRIAYGMQNLEKVWIDDFRFQPKDAAATCTSYTRDFKVAVQFDDQHFGVYYDYDIRGQLVRRRIETERGIMTVQEQTYNTQKVMR